MPIALFTVAASPRRITINRPRRPRGPLLVASALLAWFASACTPREGGTCSGHVAACIDGHSGLVCVDGAYLRMACRGPSGCATHNGQVDCDRTVAADHDRCLPTETNVGACTVDHLDLLRCNGTDMQRVTDCEGPNHCSTTPPTGAGLRFNILCDESLVSAGDPCEGNDSACSGDHSSMMECFEHHWRVRTACMGPAHCRASGTRILCDESVDVAGTACDTDGDAACLADGHGYLLCANHVNVLAGSCSGPLGCHVDGTHIACDGVFVSSVGNACLPQAACSADGHQILRCQNGAYVADESCAAGRVCGLVADRLACAPAPGARSPR